MQQRQPWVIVVQCRFCGTKVRTSNDVVADHFIANGCPDCQLRFNVKAERLLQQVQGLGPPPK